MRPPRRGRWTQNAALLAARLVRQYGAQAWFVAASRADRALELGNPAASSLWRSALKAMEPVLPHDAPKH